MVHYKQRVHEEKQNKKEQVRRPQIVQSVIYSADTFYHADNTRTHASNILYSFYHKEKY